MQVGLRQIDGVQDDSGAAEKVSPSAPQKLSSGMVHPKYDGARYE
jgi:hypothetical protein